MDESLAMQIFEAAGNTGRDTNWNIVIVWFWYNLELTCRHMVPQRLTKKTLSRTQLNMSARSHDNEAYVMVEAKYHEIGATLVIHCMDAR